MKRTVEFSHDHKVRVVTTEYGDSYWSRYVIIPRDLVLQYVREQLQSYSYNNIDPIAVCGSWFLSAGNAGPGMPFVNTPWRYSKNRKFYVWYQSGGWNV